MRLMLQVEMVMVVLILVAAVRAHAEFVTDRALTWLMLGRVRLRPARVCLSLVRHGRPRSLVPILTWDFPAVEAGVPGTHSEHQ